MSSGGGGVPLSHRQNLISFPTSYIYIYDSLTFDSIVQDWVASSPVNALIIPLLLQKWLVPRSRRIYLRARINSLIHYRRPGSD